MSEAYNKSNMEKLWGMLSLPTAFAGQAILQAASDQATLAVDPEQVDWNAFTASVEAFQELDSAAEPDGKLGPNTLRALVRRHDHDFPLPDTDRIDDPRLRMRRIAQSQLGVEESTSPSVHNPRIVAYAKEIGYGGIQDDETAWCSVFANWCALKAGLPYSGKLNARSWLNVGTSVNNPEPGDIVVFWRGSPNSWKGHVALFDSLGDGVVNVLGGNQSNKVCVMAYSAQKLLGYRRL